MGKIQTNLFQKKSPVKNHGGLKSVKKKCSLVVFCKNLEIALRMAAYRAYLRSFLSYADMTAVGALPDYVTFL